MIHRAIVGSIARFIGILIEHYGGKFPAWLAPVQALVIPVKGDIHGDYARRVVAELKAAGVRAELDRTEETLGKRIRNGTMQKIPYTLVVREKEAAAGAVAVRTRDGEDKGAIPIAEFVKLVNAG